MKFYFNYKNVIEYFVAIFISLLVYQYHDDIISIFVWPSAAFYRELMLSISASGASLLGFVLAANTFLISHTQHDRLSMLRDSKGFEQLLEIMRSSLWRLLALAICSGLSSLLSPTFTQLAAAGVLILVILCVFALATLIWATMSVLSLPLN